MTTVWSDTRWNERRDSWGWMLAYGILLAVMGALAVMEPIATDFATGLFLAFVLIAGGGLAVVAGVTAKGWHSRWLDITVGLISLALGFLVIWNPFLGAFSLVWTIGLWLVVCGGLEISAGFRPALHRNWLIGLGTVDILLGAYLLVAGPADALLILAVLVGLSFLMRGLFLSLFALRLRGLPHRSSATDSSLEGNRP